jgi:hypothetical protein
LWLRTNLALARALDFAEAPARRRGIGVASFCPDGTEGHGKRLFALWQCANPAGLIGGHDQGPRCVSSQMKETRIPRAGTYAGNQAMALQIDRSDPTP